MPGGDVVYVAAEYQASLRRALIAFKERRLWALAEPLAHYLTQLLASLEAENLLVSPPHQTLIVAVPSTRHAERHRGGHHLIRLLRHTALPSNLVWPATGSPILRVSRHVADSQGLSAIQRKANLAHRVEARAPDVDSPTRSVVLVDDIVTTGTTMAECVRALRVAGWTVAATVAIANTPKRPFATCSMQARLLTAAK